MSGEPTGVRMSQPKVGIALTGDPFDPAAWSGIPAGIVSGLRKHGVEPVPLPALPAAALRYPVMVGGWALRGDRVSAGNTAAVHAICTRQVRRNLRRAPRLDAILQIGTEFTLPRDRRYAVVLDMTVAQAVRVHPHFRSMSARTRRAWIDRQRAIFDAAHAVCPASRWVADSLISDYGVPAEKIRLIGGGANHVASNGSRDWSTPRYLFVGREWERKNGFLVLRAFARVRQQFPEARLDVVGGHPPLDSPGVTGHGELRLDQPTHRARVEDLFREATCFVMPSLCEPFGLAYIEAAASGIPVIGTTVGAAVDLVGDDSGVTVDPWDEEGLVRRMRELADPRRAAAAGAAARRRSSEFTWPKVAERLLEALSDG